MNALSKNNSGIDEDLINLRKALLEKVSKHTSKAKNSEKLEMPDEEYESLHLWQAEVFRKLYSKVLSGSTTVTYEAIIQMYEFGLTDSVNYSEQLSADDIYLIYEDVDDHRYRPEREEPVIYWNDNSPIYDFVPYDVILKVKEYLEKEKTPKPKTVVSSSLIPIKGISKAMQTKLSRQGIWDIPTLLGKGKKQNQRDSLARKLGLDVKLVNSWLKQADLWRVDQMTPDLAFLLVQAGIRNVGDLAKTDPQKVYNVIERLVLTQPDFHLDDFEVIPEIVKNAIELTESSIDIAKLTQLLSKGVQSNSGKLDLEEILLQSQKDVAFGIESNESEPVYLFRDEFGRGLDDHISGQIIQKGLKFLDDIMPALPLAHTIKGTISIKKSDENEEERKPLVDALVEIGGVASPSSDKTEAKQNPSCYTDSNGQYIIVMPDNYNLQEMVSITISKGANKQKFIRSASDLINAVPAQDILNSFTELDAIDTIIYEDSLRIRDLENITYDDKEKESERKKELAELRKEVKAQKAEYKQIEAKIKEFDKSSNILERIYENLLSSTNLEADLGEFTLTEEIFKNIFITHKKALPSVKLMGSDDEPIHLPTDTAPSRIFNYGMLQRLVEPAISTKNKKKNQRSAMTAPVDVENFKRQLYNDPDNIPQMYSLGIGYVLNMHQAWVPDGFALGSLLYSLILAPGEEQRLIVREKTESYTIQDDSMGIDMASDSYSAAQVDDTVATYNYAVDQLSLANSSSQYSTKTSSFGAGLGVGAMYKGVSAMLGLSGSYAKSSGSASSSARQSNTHREASSSAQGFQHQIKSASERVAQSKRISVRTATSEESSSVATKIIANHNHSHAMTIQYWEVMRQYKIESCIAGIDLVLFVPLRLIKFLPTGESYDYNKSITSFNKKTFNDRYGALLRHADTLNYALPYTHRTAINLLKRYAGYPNWEMENINVESRTLSFVFNSNLMSFDDITVSLVLKNGKGTVAGNVNYKREDIPDTIETSLALKQYIQDERNKSSGVTVTCTFTLPSGVTDDDLSYIRIYHSMENLEYKLKESLLSDNEQEAYRNMLGKEWDLVKDYKDWKRDEEKIAFFKRHLPESYRNPLVKLSSSALRVLGSPMISRLNLTGNSGGKLTAIPSSNTLNSTAIVNISSSTHTLRYSDFQKLESLLQHVASNALHYSQVVWMALSDDERAMMLEEFTIDMNFDNLGENNNNGTRVDIPLLNCVNVKQVVGFYGNCILLPFTFPKSLADVLGKTAAEVQDELYRYHTTNFRVPSTTISLPTEGMIGEAVLGETNVSELIDLTRFWNWKDSPIDKMGEVTADWLGDGNYLDNKNTATITPLNVNSATAPQAVQVNDLLTAMISKQTPKFDDITGLDNLKDILNKATETTASGRDKVLDVNKEIMVKAMDALTGGGSDKKDVAKDDKKPGAATNDTKPKEEPKPSEDPKPTEEPKPSEEPKPTEEPKPAEEPKEDDKKDTEPKPSE